MVDDALADHKDGEQNSALGKIHRETLFVLPHAWQGRPIFSYGEEAIKPWQLCMLGTRRLGSIPYSAFIFFIFFFAFFVALLGLLNGHQPWQHGRSLNSVERVRVSRANATEPVSLGPPCNLLHTFYQTSFSTRPVRRDTPGFWPTRRLNGAGCRGCHRCQFNACTVQPRYWPMEVLLCRPFTSYKGTASKKHQNMQNSAAKSF